MEIDINVIIIMPIMIRIGALKGTQEFPIHEFLQLTKDVDLVETKKYFLCNGSTSRLGRCCSCDLQECTKKLSCCMDAFWNSQNFKGINEYKDYITEYASRHNRKCIDIFPLAKQSKSKVTSSKYVMINKCIKNTNSHDVNLCTSTSSSLQDSIPVYSENFTLFKNRHCAACNSISSFQFVPLAKTCNKDVDTACNFDIKMNKERTDHFGSKCKEQSEGSCDKESKLYHGCVSYDAPIGEFFCFLCQYDHNNIYKPIDIKFPKNFFNSETGICSARERYLKGTLSWSSLIRLNLPRKKKKKCNSSPGSELEDFLRDGCINVDCPDGFKVVGNGCREISTREIILNQYKVTFDSCFFEKKSFQIHFINLTNPLHIIEYLKQRIIEKPYFEILFFDEILIIVKVTREIMDIEQLVENELGSMMKHVGRKGRIALTPNYHPLPNVEMDLYQIFPRYHICSNPILVKNPSFLPECDIIFNNTALHKWKVALWIEVANLTNEILRRVLICEQLYLPLSCPLRILTSNSSILDNKSMIHMANNKSELFEFNEYFHLDNKRYAVCDTSIRGQPTWLEIVLAAEGYISIIGSTLSFISYICILILIYNTKELQNVPGFFIVALSISLLLCDGLFLCANAISISGITINKHLCESIGILMHFFLLTSQFLGTSFALDIMKNITSIRGSLKNSRIYSFITISISLSLFIIFMVLMLREYKSINSSYNEGGVCVLHGYYARMISLYVPLLLSNVISLLILAVMIYRFSIAIKKSKEVLVNSHVNHYNLCHVFIRLILMCGLPEMLGLLHIHRKNLTKEETEFNLVFGFLYSTIKSCRGFPLLVIFLVRKAAISDLREKREHRASIGYSTED